MKRIILFILLLISFTGYAQTDVGFELKGGKTLDNFTVMQTELSFKNDICPFYVSTIFDVTIFDFPIENDIKSLGLRIYKPIIGTKHFMTDLYIGSRYCFELFKFNNTNIIPEGGIKLSVNIPHTIDDLWFTVDCNQSFETIHPQTKFLAGVKVVF